MAEKVSSALARFASADEGEDAGDEGLAWQPDKDEEDLTG